MWTGDHKYRRAEKSCGLLAQYLSKGMSGEQLHPDVDQLVQCLLKIEQILAKHQEEFWLSKIVSVRKTAENSDGHCVMTFLSFFGGMGSFNDLVLNAPNTANDALDRERRRAYELAQYLK